MEKSKSPLSEVASLISGRRVRCVLDSAPASCDVEALASQILLQQKPTDTDDIYLVRVAAPWLQPDSAPWVNLVAGALEQTGWGRAVSVSLTDSPSGDDLLSVLSNKKVRDSSVVTLRPPGPAVTFKVDSHAQLESATAIAEAKKNLVRWASLEQHVPTIYPPLFSHVAGGTRPVLYVFDDYNNFITEQNGYFRAADQTHVAAIAEWYLPAEPGKFHGFLGNYARNLNNLSVAYRVRTPNLWLGGNADGPLPADRGRPGKRPAPGYAEVAATLPFAELERDREKIAAFVVDLEWMPTLSLGEGNQCIRLDEAWSNLGFRAIQLLSRRFPEIPCFVYTGQSTEPRLHEALAHGAQWCFWKDSHHGRGSGARREQQLTCITLTQHLAQVARIRHGAFEQPPYRDQLQVDLRTAAAKKLVKQLKIKAPVGRCSRGLQLQRLVSRLFPDGATICPVHVQESGTKAKATFFVSVDRRGNKTATRFVKIGSWPQILREHLAYQNIFLPRLNSYIANVIAEPVFAEGTKGEMLAGALMYSLAGLPEGYDRLQSLGTLLDTVRDDPAACENVSIRLRSTVQEVLFPLYGLAGTRDRPPALRRPLWRWLGRVMPPAFTGELIPLTDDGAEGSPEFRSYGQDGYKQETAWILATHDAIRPPAGTVKLSGFWLDEVSWQESDADQGSIILRHSDLGFRIELRGRNEDLRRRFSGPWMRPGMPVEVGAKLDKDNRTLRKKLEDPLKKAIGKLQLQDSKHEDISALLSSQPVQAAFTKAELVCPLKLLQALPFSFGIEAHEAAIHGDLNQQNILFAKGEPGPGWLIDFERAEEHGMLALDLATIECDIWLHHLLPRLEALAEMLPEPTSIVRLLRRALTCVDNPTSGDAFHAVVHTDPSLSTVREGLLRPATDYVRIICDLRKLAAGAGVTDSEMHWALGVFSLNCVRLAHEELPWLRVLLYIASAWHLAAVAPRIEHAAEEILRCDSSGWDSCTRDGLLVQMRPPNISAFAKAVAGQGVEWPTGASSTERWDVASTGGVGTITPILGYLWLMAKAQSSYRDGKFDVAVPKLAAEGASCGTVDILQAGGLTFPESGAAIVSESLAQGGVLCRQTEQITPVDRQLMERRRVTNTMKNAAVTCASIIGEKLSVGCTHVVIDVKLGHDTKMLAPWSVGEWRKAFLLEQPDGDEGHAPKLIPPHDEPCRAFIELIGEIGGGTLQIPEDRTWVEATFQHDKGPLVTKWFFTDGGVPQCRAIGRELILLHLDGLIEETYDFPEHKTKKPESLLSLDQYRRLYCELIPTLCEVDLNFDILKGEWRRLRRRLPRMEQFVARKYAQRWLFRSGHDASTAQLEQPIDLSAHAHDLSLVTFGIHPYRPIATGLQTVEVSRMNAYVLDGFFDWLCGDDPYDEEVGIWLHHLPGEVMDVADPLISVFHRPSRGPLDELFQRIRKFLCQGVEVKDPREVKAPQNDGA